MIPGTLEKPHPGIVRWRNKNGCMVLKLHYTSDPDKSSDWAKSIAHKYPGGFDGKGWQAEMEIDFLARTGGRIYPDFKEATHVFDPRAAFPPHGILPRAWPRFRGIDPGYHNPTACLWVAVDPDTNFWVYREHYESGWTVAQHASAIKGLTGRERVEFSVIDPSASAKTLQSQNSIADQFAAEGVYASPADNRVADGISAVAELMRICDNGEPRIKVSSDCPVTIRELLGYRWRSLPDVLAQRRGEYEEPVKKDDHTCDALRYVVMATPEGYMRSRGMSDPFYVPKEGLTERIWKSIERSRASAASEGEYL